MRYFDATRIGQERADRSAEVLAKVTGYAKGAVFLRHESTPYEPVGEENLYSVIPLRPPSVVVVLCDSGGNAKAMSQYLNPRTVENILKKLETMGISKYEGEPYLPM